MGGSSTRRTRRFARGGPAARDRLPAATCAREPVIVADGDRVLQIISNLLSNAFRWTPDGGRIELELAAENGHVSVAVGRHGPGDRAERARADLPPVLVARRRRHGPRARDRAASSRVALGGRIELETEVGRGSRFELVLPAASG